MSSDSPPDHLPGHVPFSPAVATEVLAQPRWAYLLFEASITENELGDRDDVNPFLVPGMTTAELAGYVEIDRTVLGADLEALADRGVFRREEARDADESSAGSAFRTTSYQLFPDEPIDFPDGGTADRLPPSMLGAVGYGYHDAAVPRFLHRYSYDRFWDAVNVFQKMLLGDSVERTLEAWFPDVADEDVTSIRPALEYAYGRLSEDPVWRCEYPVEPP